MTSYSSTLKAHMACILISMKRAHSVWESLSFQRLLPVEDVTREGLSPIWFSTVQFSRSVVSNSLRPHGLQHAKPPCPSPTPGVYSNSCPLSQWCHLTMASSVIPFSSCLQSFPASKSLPVIQFFAWGGQSIGASASTSALPMNIQDWFPLGFTDFIHLLSKRLSKVFHCTTVQKYQFLGAQPSL